MKAHVCVTALGPTPAMPDHPEATLHALGTLRALGTLTPTLVLAVPLLVPALLWAGLVLIDP
eukprot:13179818-Alexandrium_andersonii.AAC.1